MDLYNQLVNFSEGRPNPTPKGNPNISACGLGLGYHEFTWPIIQEVTEKWLQGDLLTKLKKSNWNLGMITGSEVWQQTRDNFSWPKISRIIENDRISIALIEYFGLEYPNALDKFSFYNIERFSTYNMKRLCQTLAKAALFIEAVAFLEGQGCGEILKN